MREKYGEERERGGVVVTDGGHPPSTPFYTTDLTTVLA